MPHLQQRLQVLKDDYEAQAQNLQSKFLLREQQLNEQILGYQKDLQQAHRDIEAESIRCHEKEKQCKAVEQMLGEAEARLSRMKEEADRYFRENRRKQERIHNLEGQIKQLEAQVATYVREA